MGVLPAVLVFGIGWPSRDPLTATALGAVPDEHSGLASAVNNDVARIGTFSRWRCSGAGRHLDQLSPPAELSAGFRTAVLLSAVLCVAGGILAAVGIRNPPRSPDAG